jgi:type VI secretion system secreted protein VgrG
MPHVDLQAGTIALVLLLVLFAVLAVRGGLRTIRSARRMTFFHLRKRREASGWRQLGFSVLLLLVAVALPIYGLPVAYHYFPPSPTPSLTPTITPIPSTTLSPTITLSPTVTDTPVESPTPTASATPHVPEPIFALFQSTVTPNPDVVFSPIEFTTAGSDYPAVDPSTVFQNPVGHVYGIFTYDGMVPGAQWTALWFREGELVGYETKPWDGATGGSGYTDWDAPASEWTPAIYSVQIFVGERFVVSGRFLVQGDAPTEAVDLSPTPTGTTTLAVLSSGTPGPIRTSTPTSTGAR